MNSLDVFAYVGLPFDTVRAIGTFETRLLPAFVAQMPLQRASPSKNARTIRAGIFLVIRVAVPYSLLVANVRVTS